jgi:hypothetical protein
MSAAVAELGTRRDSTGLKAWGLTLNSGKPTVREKPTDT